MKRIVTVICLYFIFAPHYIHAQIENEIKSYVDSTEFMINNGKKMLVQQITEKDFAKTKEVYDYLNILTSSISYTAFDYSEEILVNLLMGDWTKLSFILKNYTNLVSTKIYPGTNDIYTSLFYQVKSMSDSISAECINAELDNETKDLIQLILHLYKKEDTDSKYYSLLEKYNKNYKFGQYKDFIRNYLPKGNMHSFIDFTVGTGMIMTTGKLAESFNPNISFNTSMDLIYKRLYTSVYMNVTGLKLQESFVNESDIETLYFDKGESFLYFDGGIKAGILIANKNYLRIAPYCSFSGSHLESNLYDSESDFNEFEVFNSFAYGVGITTEFLSKNFSVSHPGQYLGMKIDAAYNVMGNIEDTYFTGNLPYINIGIVYGFGDIKKTD